MDTQVDWNSLIEWDCDLNPSNIENTPDAIVAYQKEFKGESFSPLEGEYATVVLRVVESDERYLTVTCHEVTDIKTRPVFRNLCSSVDEVSSVLESVSKVYEDGQDAMRIWVENNLQTDFLSEIEETFETDVYEFRVKDDYSMVLEVSQMQNDLLGYVGSHTTSMDITPVSEDSLRITCSAPLIL